MITLGQSSDLVQVNYLTEKYMKSHEKLIHLLRIMR